MKRVITIIMIINSIIFIGCSSYVSNSDEKEIKEVIDKVFSYDIEYDESLRNYINEENFYTSNYRFFYTLFLGDLSSFNYESQLKSVSKEAKEYIACLVLNLKAEGELVYENDEDEGHRASIEGVDVPVKVTLKKTDRGFYIKSVEEYDSLDIAKEECAGFQ